MKYYVQFKKYNLANEISDCLGTDGVYILDGRNKLNTMIVDAFEQIYRLRRVQKGIIGFVIHKGNFRQSVPITPFIPNDETTKQTYRDKIYFTSV